MKKFDEIRKMLAEMILKEKKRLKSYSTHANHFDLANALGRHIESMMAYSRHDELKLLVKKYPEYAHKSHVKERLKATGRMADLLKKTAENLDSKRPWRPTGQDKKKHGSHRRAHSSKH
jgi:hypothetical protein